jgi:hypothetical protein
MPKPWWRRRPIGVAFAFAAVGLAATGGALRYPDSRTVLFVLGAIFLFSAILTGVLGAERRIDAWAAEGIYADTAANVEALVEAYELRGPTVYLPHRAGEDPRAWVFVPRTTDFELPPVGTLRPLFVGPTEGPPRGISLRPSGDGLFRDVEAMLDGTVSDAPGELAMELADGLTEGLELAEDVEPVVDPDERRVTFRIAGNAYGRIDRLDHPVQSLLGVGCAVGLDRPVLAETSIDDGRYDYAVRCYWPQEVRDTDSGDSTVEGESAETNRAMAETARRETTD